MDCLISFKKPLPKKTSGLHTKEAFNGLFDSSTVSKAHISAKFFPNTIGSSRQGPVQPMPQLVPRHFSLTQKCKPCASLLLSQWIISIPYHTCYESHVLNEIYGWLTTVAPGLFSTRRRKAIKTYFGQTNQDTQGKR
ncbi:hypothetical protein TNCV_1424441 [Trichonephila clavipes]|nr:hypothetical protein TNCV_1424441 [Trichonephila clavipes]